MPLITPQTQTGAVDEVSFDNTYLRGDGGTAVDTSRFTRGNAVTPGTYSVDLIVNGMRLAREDIRFAAPDGKLGSKPCFSRALLQRAGVDLAKADAAAGRSCCNGRNLRRDRHPGPRRHGRLRLHAANAGVERAAGVHEEFGAWLRVARAVGPGRQRRFYQLQREHVSHGRIGHAARARATWA